MTRVRSRAFATPVHCYTSAGLRMTEECESMARGDARRRPPPFGGSASAPKRVVGVRAAPEREHASDADCPHAMDSTVEGGARLPCDIGGHAGGQWQGRQAPRSHGVTN